MTKEFQNLISYCDRCYSTLYWNNYGHPNLVNSEIKNEPTCVEKGCSLTYVKTPVEFAGPYEMDLLRLALIRAGMGEEAAALTVANLGYDPQTLAA